MFHMFRPAATGTAVALALTLSLSACQGDTETASETPASPSASQTPTASPSPTDVATAAKDDNVKNAEKRHREFLNIRNAHAKKGEDPFADLLNDGYLGNAEMRESEQSFWGQYVDLGLKQVGESHIESVEATEYEGDPRERDITGHRVHLKVCMDNSDYDVVRPDGSSAIAKGSSRLVMNVVMQGQPAGLWSVAKTQSTGNEC